MTTQKILALGGNLPASVETLADRIAREGPINELDAVGWAIRLAKRIETMHALGVTHGNLSPSVIQVEGREREARAQLVDVRRSPTALECQSPERIAGGEISQADDTWALACTLYMALTGSPAFSGANDDDLRQKILGSSPAPLAVFDVGDDDLQRIVDEAFTRDRGQRTATVAALRAALEEWHPDPKVGALPAIEEEGAGDGDGDEEDEDERTILRSPLSVLGRPSPPFGAAGAPPPPASSPGPARGASPLLGSGPGSVSRLAPLPRASYPGAPPAAAPPGRAGTPVHGADNDEDEDVRTIMRTVPEHVSSRFSGSASRSGAFAAMAPGSSGAFPAVGAHAEIGDDEATRMIQAPSFPGPDEDDDDQKTLMRSSLPPDEVPGRGASDRAAPRPLPAAGAAPSFAGSPVSAPFAAAPAPLAAAPAPIVAPPAASPVPAPPLGPLPVPALLGAAPSASAAAMVPASAPRRTALWITLLALILAAAGGVFFALR